VVVPIIDPKDDDKTTRFLVNNLVGPPPKELIPVVPEDVAEIVREDTIGVGAAPIAGQLATGGRHVH